MQTIEPGPLAAWVASQTGDDDEKARVQQLAKYIRVNQMLAPWLEDDGKYGYYANNRKASFYRKLLSANPFILDVLLEGTADQIATVACALQIFFQGREKHGASGRLSQLVVPLDRAPLAVFLAEEASPESRALIHSMLSEVYRSKISLHETSKRMLFMGRYQPLVVIRRELISHDLEAVLSGSQGSEGRCRPGVTRRTTGKLDRHAMELGMHAATIRLEEAEGEELQQSHAERGGVDLTNLYEIAYS